MDIFSLHNGFEYLRGAKGGQAKIVIFPTYLFLVCLDII